MSGSYQNNDVKMLTRRAFLGESFVNKQTSYMRKFSRSRKRVQVCIERRYRLAGLLGQSKLLPAIHLVFMSERLRKLMG